MAKKTYAGAAAALGLLARAALAQTPEGQPAGGTGAVDWLVNHIGYVAVAAILLAFLAVGIPDLLRLSARRLWAISSVSFRESVRRRVLWVTPLAMLGIIAVTQLSHPVDEQDAIRQTTKYALFASGLVVVVATLILACTSLPKEIDNRVIYTIVTKPATRLEIVLGKTLGFARTSALILLVMGVFSYLYLHVNASQLQSSIRARLQALPAGDFSRDTLQHYADEGLLLARTYARPVELQMYAQVPKPGDRFTWTTGAGEQSANYPFVLPASALDNPDAHLIFEADVAISQPRAMTRREVEENPPDPSSTTRPTTQGAVERLPGKPRVTVMLVDENGTAVVPPAEMNDLLHANPNDPNSLKATSNILLDGITGREGVGRLVVAVPAKAMNERVRPHPATPDGYRHLALMITGETPATRFGFAPDAVRLRLAVPDPTGQPQVTDIPRVDEKGQPTRIAFRGRMSSTRAQQLPGDDNAAEAPIGVYSFNAPGLAPTEETVPFEFRTKIERSGEAEATEAENVTRVEVTLHNRKTGHTTAPIAITPDSDRPTFFRAPRAGVEGGEFDVRLQSRTPGHVVGLRSNSLAVVAATQSFAANLAKSLFILWLLSVLVVVIAIFCSTFVSWPIAVVLTLVLLLGRWCVVQLGEPSSPQQMATDFFGAKAGGAQTRVFTDTVGALNKLLTFTAKLLPDLDQFRVTEDIERGVTVPLKSLTDPLTVLLVFGLPLLILAYLFLRRKEVAP